VTLIGPRQVPGDGGEGRGGLGSRGARAASGRGGVPRWLERYLNHCARCGAGLVFGPVAGEERDRLSCPACGFIAYVNPRLVVTTLPVTDDGRLVLLRRGIEPGYGAWAQPGGFLEVDETAHEGAVRETLEETGLEVEPEAIVGLYSRPEAAIVVVAFEARITGGAPTVTPEALEVRPFHPREIPWDAIAFHTSLWAITDWVALRAPEHMPAGGAPEPVANDGPLPEA
jgi:ADP-ribose pyrophosphatase YjhB (NUDIX family)